MTNQQQTPRYSVRLGRERIDVGYCFECRRCLRETAARDDSCGDAIDVHSDLCSECWLHIRESADRFFSLVGERIVPPRGDTSGRRGGECCWMWPDISAGTMDYAVLDDGSAWYTLQRMRRREWVCVRGPRTCSGSQRAKSPGSNAVASNRRAGGTGSSKHSASVRRSGIENENRQRN